MELDIVRTITVKSGISQQTDSETVTKFEIMDGAAVKSKRRSFFLGNILLFLYDQSLRACFIIV